MSDEVKTEEKVEEKKEEKVEEKKEEPVEEKPKKFDFHKFKYKYNNDEDTKGVCTWLWENWVGTGHSWWVATLKKDLFHLYAGKAGFIVANRIGGYFRYIEQIKKKSFCSAVVVSDEEKDENYIHMLWLFTGKKIAKELRKDTVVGKGLWHDFEWKKMDPTKEEDRKLMTDYLCWEDEIAGLTYEGGKVF